MNKRNIITIIALIAISSAQSSFAPRQPQRRIPVRNLIQRFEPQTPVAPIIGGVSQPGLATGSIIVPGPRHIGITGGTRSPEFLYSTGTASQIGQITGAPMTTAGPTHMGMVGYARQPDTIGTNQSVYMVGVPRHPESFYSTRTTAQVDPVVGIPMTTAGPTHMGMVGYARQLDTTGTNQPVYMVGVPRHQESFYSMGTTAQVDPVVGIPMTTAGPTHVGMVGWARQPETGQPTRIYVVGKEGFASEESPILLSPAKRVPDFDSNFDTWSMVSDDDIASLGPLSPVSSRRGSETILVSPQPTVTPGIQERAQAFGPTVNWRDLNLWQAPEGVPVIPTYQLR